MRDKTRRMAAILLFLLAVLGSGLACGSQSRCYSQFDGCDATAEAIATAAAHGD